MSNPKSDTKRKNAKKQSVRTAIVYFATLFCFLLVLGVIAYFILSRYVFTASASNKSQSHVQAKYIPENDDASTVLFALTDEGEMELAMLIRIEPVQREILCVPIPVDTVSKINTKQATIKEFYEKSGPMVFQTAVENAYGVPINRFAVLSKYAFSELVEQVGGISFPLPFNMLYENPNTGEITNFKCSDIKSVFWGDDLRKIMTYPLAPQGKEYNINISGGIICTLINECVKSSDRVISHLDDMYKAVRAFSETNITEYDFRLEKNAIEYIMSSGNERPARFCVPDGKWQSDGTFITDVGVANEIKTFFYI